MLDGRGLVGDALGAEGLVRPLGMSAGFDPAGLCRLARLLRQLRPAVVHIHTHAIGAVCVALLALPRAARIYTEHSPRALHADRKFRVLYLLLRIAAVRAVVPSRRMRSVLETHGIARRQITLVRYPLTIPRRAAPRADERARTVGVVCRLEPQKRVDLLIDLVAELRSRRVDCSALVVGGGSQLPLLTARARRVGVEDLVEFAGEQDDVVPWLDRIDVFLMSSSFEPFGIAGLEAMARGVPLVAMPCPGGLADLAELGGTLLPDRAVGTAADAVALLLGSAEARRRSRARGDAVVAEHDPRRVVEELERVYAAS